MPEAPHLETAIWFLRHPLVNAPVSETVYSNAGYVVAGAVLEIVTGRPIERIFQLELFQPLWLEAAFGEPRFLGEDQPFGHYVKDGDIVVYEEEPPLPAFLVAAGNVSISMEDYIDYLQMHLC